MKTFITICAASKGARNGDYYDTGIFGMYKITGQGKEIGVDWIYEGEFVDGDQNGKGKIEWLDGDIYKGNFINRMRTGQGSYETLDSLYHTNGGYCSKTYVVNNKIATDEEGSIGVTEEGPINTTGGSDSNKPQGSISNGFIYEGYFINGHFHGKGKITYEDGTWYDGDWVDCVREGKGTEFGNWSSGTYTYNGDFMNDSYHGNGEIKWSDGTKYIGEFEYGFRNGEGIYTYINGFYYDGRWSYGSRTGYGDYYNEQGNLIYSGVWESNLFNGEGTYLFPNSGSYKAEWINGTYNDGEVVNLTFKETGLPCAEGYWKNNIFYGRYYENAEWHDMP